MQNERAAKKFGLSLSEEDLIISFPQLANDYALSKWMSEVRNGERRVDPDSSPGNPWITIGPTNRDVFEFDELVGYEGGNITLLREAVLLRMQELGREPRMDDVHLFIKPEPHSPEKLQKEKYRLISGVGLTDQLIIRLLTEDVITDVNNHPLQDGLAAGWSPFADGGLTAILNVVGRGKKMCADRSSWDWSCQEFTLLSLGEVMLWLNDDLPKSLQKVLWNHVRAIAGVKTFENHGDRFLAGPGIMLSGWYWTLVGNSIMQIFCHELTNIKLNMETKPHLAMGDDTVGEPLSQEFLQKMQDCTGMILKETQTYENEFEFCGMHFRHSQRSSQHRAARAASFHPVYEGKHAFQLAEMTREEATELLPSYQWLYMYDEEKLSSIHNWMRQVGVADMVFPAPYMHRKVQGLPYKSLNPSHYL